MHLCSNALLHASAIRCLHAKYNTKELSKLCTTKLTELCSNAIWRQRSLSVSITQAAAVITDTYTIVDDNWDPMFTRSDRHHLLTVKLKHAKSLNGSIIETSFLPNSQWTCTGTMAKGDYWIVNTFNTSFDDRRAAMVSLRSMPQNFDTDNVEVRNSMSSDVAQFLCSFSNV